MSRYTLREWNGNIVDNKKCEELEPAFVVERLNEQNATIRRQKEQMHIVMRYLLSDSCSLTDGQLRSIKQELAGVDTYE